VLGRRRILVYTQPPIEPAWILCQVAADMCFDDQTALESSEGSTTLRPRLKARQKQGINVLGVVTVHDIGLLERESVTGRSWIACAFFPSRVFACQLFLDLQIYSLRRYDGYCVLRETSTAGSGNRLRCSIPLALWGRGQCRLLAALARLPCRVLTPRAR
jgi:hypothetical protein